MSEMMPSTYAAGAYLSTTNTPFGGTYADLQYRAFRDDVAATARHLDQHKPGWAVRVNVDTLNLRSQRDCVLGQVYRLRWFNWLPFGPTTGFARGLRQLPRTGVMFTGVLGSRFYEPFWIDEILARQAAAAAAPPPLPLLRRLRRFWRTRPVASLFRRTAVA